MATLQERLGNLGYGSLKKETTAGTPVTPNTYFKFYKATLNTDMNYDEDNPVAGVRSAPFSQFPGIRKHEGQLTVLAEPNTARYWFDMMLAIGNVSGGGPYTWPFTEGLSNSYTIDLLKGQVVERYWGVKVEDIECAFNKNKMELNLAVKALGSFTVRKIATVNTTTITLDTTYDPTPNKGLVASDVIRVMAADGNSTLDTTVSSVNADGITVVLGATAAAFAAGDLIFLRAATATYVEKTPFMWARTEFRFGTSASAALSATQLRLQQGSKWKLAHKIGDDGSDRSGSFDPESNVQLQTEADLNLKTFFDQPQRLEKYLSLAANEALVIRHFSEGSAYEMRLTFNQLRYKLNKRDFDSGKILYQDLTGKPNYFPTDGQMFDVKILNNVSS